MKYSAHYNMYLPENTDFFTKDHQNNNIEIIDAAMNKKLETTGGIMTGSVICNKGANVIRITDVMQYTNTSSGVAGTLKIKLPNSSARLVAKIKGHETDSSGEFELTVGGQYTASTDLWTNYTAKLNGSSVTFSTVRFATDTDGSPCILLGTTSSVWNYAFLDVTEVVFKNVGGMDLLTYSNSWSASIITDETGIYNIDTPILFVPITTAQIVNNLAATDPTTVLAGPMGKSLDDKITSITPTRIIMSATGVIPSTSLEGMVVTNAATSVITLTMPTPVNNSGKKITIVNGSSNYNVILATPVNYFWPAVTTTFTLTPTATTTFISDGSNWIPLNDHGSIAMEVLTYTTVASIAAGGILVPTFTPTIPAGYKIGGVTFACTNGNADVALTAISATTFSAYVFNRSTSTAISAGVTVTARIWYVKMA